MPLSLPTKKTQKNFPFSKWKIQAKFSKYIFLRRNARLEALQAGAKRALDALLKDIVRNARLEALQAGAKRALDTSLKDTVEEWAEHIEKE